MSLAVVAYSLIGVLFAASSAALSIYALTLYDLAESDVLTSRLVASAFVIAMCMFFGSSAAYLVPSPPPEEVLARVLIFRLPLLVACGVLFWLLRYVEKSLRERSEI